MNHRDHRNGTEFDTQAKGELPDAFFEVSDVLAEQGFEGIARAMQTLINEAMKLELGDVLGARP